MNPFEKAKAKIEEQQRQKSVERQTAAMAAEAANQASIEKFEQVLQKLESLLTPSMQGLGEAGYDPAFERRMFPPSQAEAALLFASNEVDAALRMPVGYRITVVVRSNFSSQIGCEIIRGDLAEQDPRMVKRYLLRPVALPPFKHEEFEAALDEKLERIFTKILQSEPRRRTGGNGQHMRR